MSNLVMSDIDITVPNQAQKILSIPYLNIKQGEKIVLMGRSGSGKTTLINLISGLKKPTSGMVKWDDIVINHLNQSQTDQWRFKHIGLVMQNFYLYPGLSALQNVLLPVGFRKLILPQNIKQQAQALLNRVGIVDIDRNINFLSRGEMQRVAIVRALLNKPSIIIADEPTASLDSQSGQEIIELLFELTDEIKATLILATHQHAFLSHFERQIILHDGLITTDKKGDIL